MKKLQSFKIHAFYVFLLQILSLLVQSSAYTSPTKYFINCGTNTNTTEYGRTFVGDSDSRSLQYTKQDSYPVNSNKPAQGSFLYQTARVFEQSFNSYQFDISTTGIYLLRLHFFAFPSSKDLSTASFNVSASEFLLLRASSFLNNTNESPVKEFFIDISKTGKFDIYFVPESSSFAFVNAIELFPAPNRFIPNNAPAFDASGNTKIYKGLLSKNVLHTIHRINVGGAVVAPENDTKLWRYWVPDDTYLINSDSAEKSPQYTDQLSGQDENTDAFATDYVYKTAKSLKSNSSNATWGFLVDRKSKHFVRVHFCDIISDSENLINFNLYINGNYIENIDPYNETGKTATPFRKDFVVDSDDSGLVNIAIGLNNSSLLKDAFLNGLEIMKISEELSSVPLTPNGEKKKMNIFVIIGSVLGGLVFIGIIVLLLFLGLKCKKPKSVDTAVWSVLPGGGSTHSKVLEGTIDGSSLGLKIPFVEVKNATKNFSDKLMIGRGGFGKVYKGVLKNGMRVAVKRSEPGSGQGLPEFQTEIMVLSKIRHRHLVSLIGYCDERSEMILVYEFMENGTLRDHLYGSKLPCLPWKKRLEICIGAARGLHYLHKGSAGGIIHRDVKSTNILLDEHYEAKVADFGLSRLGPNDESYTHVSTGVKGTFGYLDPEYFRSQQLTEKSDVYSFGVVLLEVLCVRLAINPLLPREQVNLAEWALLCKNKGILEEILDPLIKHEINPNSLRKFAEVAEKCLQEEGVDRPAMSDVMWDLEYALSLQQAAVHREPHEDSTTQSSSMFPAKNVQHLPSLGSEVETDVDWVSKKVISFSSTTEKFNSAENQ